MKTRMSIERRNKLLNFVCKVVGVPGELQTEVDNRRDLVNLLIKQWMCETFPQDDMQVLAKYKCASPDYCVKFKAEDRPVVGWTFSKDEPDMPLMPRSAHTYSTPVHALDTTEIPDAIFEWEKAKERRETALQQLRQPYFDLVRSARYFEDVVEVWSEVKSIEAEIVPPQNALVTLSSNTVAAIKADMKRRGV